ncbi:MAG: nuclear transport factor 2 family protein [Carbonactinosporaceae bacterium]
MKARGREIYLGDVLDPSNSDALGVGFARYAPGESNHWVVTHDEVLMVARGAFSVTSADGQKTTAQEGEVIFLPRNTRLTYSAEDSGAEVVYVSYPHWTKTQLASEHADLLATFQPATDRAPRTTANGREANLTLLKQIHDPLERGDSLDFSPFFDALADDVFFSTPGGEVRGKRAFISYLTHASETMEFAPFERPIEYYAGGSKVVMASRERFTVKATGQTHHAEWTWIIDMDGGRISRILHVQDLTGVAHLVKEALDEAQAETADTT